MSSTDLIKKLRDMTQAGVMDAVKALKECNDDLEKAAQWLREKGIAKATKKAGAIVTEGVAKAVVNGNYGAVVEINSQTDFVSNGEDFQALVKQILKVIHDEEPKDLNTLVNTKINGNDTVNDACINLTAKVGEKICVRRLFAYHKKENEAFSIYEHFNGKIAVILILDSQGKDEVGKSVAMHIAAMNPKFLDTNNVDQAWLNNEKEVLKKQTLAEGKPADRVDMIVNGRIHKSMAEVCLSEQQFVKDPTKSIKQYLKENNTNVLSFTRYEVGEGVEKKQEDFAAEVAKQMNQ